MLGAFSFRFPRREEKEDPNAWSLERNLASSDVIQAFLVYGSSTTELKHVSRQSNWGNHYFTQQMRGVKFQKKPLKPRYFDKFCFCVFCFLSVGPPKVVRLPTQTMHFLLGGKSLQIRHLMTPVLLFFSKNS